MIDQMPVDARLDAWLSALHAAGGSGILLTDGSKPLLRVAGELKVLGEAELLTGEEIEAIARGQIDDHYGDRLHLGREVDFSFTWRDRYRVRGSAFYQRQACSVSLRCIPLQIPTIDELGLPPRLRPLLTGSRGLILVTGQAGSGKSTSMAAMVDEINRTRRCHIVTVEDPIEFVHTNKQSAVSQREIGSDTHSYATALRSVLREDPDVVAVGDLRDAETIAAVLDIAETGHLVIAALTTNDAASSLERILDVFPRARSEQVRVQLAGTFLAVLYQRLVPRVGGGLTPAHELLVGVPSVRLLLRQGRTSGLRAALAGARESGMQTLEQSLSSLVDEGVIDLLSAVEVSLHPEDLAGSALGVRS
jgi:twitching motility protein PilT